MHRILGAALDGKRDTMSPERLHAIADDCSETERRAADAERELVEWKKAKFMEERVGEQFRGLIISTTRFGFFVELEDLFVEGLVPIESLPGDRYVYHENVRKIIGQRTRRQFSIGDTVEVLLDRVDPIERKLQFSLDRAGAGQRKRRNSRRSHECERGTHECVRHAAMRPRRRAAGSFAIASDSSRCSWIPVPACSRCAPPSSTSTASFFAASTRQSCCSPGVESRDVDARGAARTGDQLSQEIARENLVIDSFERRSG